MKSFSSSRILWLVILALPLSQPVLAQDDYLSSLEAEADRTTVLEQAKAEHKKLKKLTSKGDSSASRDKTAQVKPPVAAKPASAHKVPAGKAFHKFENDLFTEFPGNYAVYSSLTDEQKKEVFDVYQSASDKEGLLRFGPVLGKILELGSQ